MPRKQNVEVDGIGFEIKGLHVPPFKREPLVAQPDIAIEVPNGDLHHG
jgi:hypothetical protein